MLNKSSEAGETVYDIFSIEREPEFFGAKEVKETPLNGKTNADVELPQENEDVKPFVSITVQNPDK